MMSWDNYRWGALQVSWFGRELWRCWPTIQPKNNCFNIIQRSIPDRLKEGRKERKKAEGKSNRKTEKNEQMNQRGMRVPVVAADAWPTILDFHHEMIIKNLGFLSFLMSRFCIPDSGRKKWWLGNGKRRRRNGKRTEVGRGAVTSGDGKKLGRRSPWPTQAFYRQRPLPRLLSQAPRGYGATRVVIGLERTPGYHPDIPGDGRAVLPSFLPLVQGRGWRHQSRDGTPYGRQEEDRWWRGDETQAWRKSFFSFFLSMNQ